MFDNKLSKMQLDAQNGLVLITTLLLASVQASTDQLRDTKHFSLFSVVTFKNEECMSETTFAGGATAGTCYTATECGDKGGTKSGNCASGFGVCCIMVYTTMASGTISENRTHLRNLNYPAVETATPSASIVYTINKMQSDICQIRLDFDNFVIGGPANTVEVANAPIAQGTTNCKDAMTTTLASGFIVPVLCGVLTNEHLYLDLGMDSTDTAILTFTWATTAILPAANAFRSWSIKTSQIPCWASYRAPEGCHRYFMQNSGQIISYNFARLAAETPTAVGRATTQLLSAMDLLGQDVKSCIRREKNMCCTRFQVCTQYGGAELTSAQGSATGGNNAQGWIHEAWSFHTDLTGSGVGTTGQPATTIIYDDQGIVDGQCWHDYVEIPDSSTGMRNLGASVQVNTRYCGTRFGYVPPIGDPMVAHTQVYDCTEPWEVTYHTDIFNDIGATNGATGGNTDKVEFRGMCLDFNQEAC